MVKGWNDPSIKVLELLGKVSMAWMLATRSEILPSYAQDNILMRGDNTPGVHWVSKCSGGGGDWGCL